MARKWTKNEEILYKKELQRLYVNENKTINEVGRILNLSPQTVFQRLQRLGIKSAPEKKQLYLNRRASLQIPNRCSEIWPNFLELCWATAVCPIFKL